MNVNLIGFPATPSQKIRRIAIFLSEMLRGPNAVPSPRPSEGRGEGQGEVREREKGESSSSSNGRLRWLRFVLLAAMLSGILCCIPLWLSTREYPLVPLFPHWLILPVACGPWLLGLVLASLVAGVWIFRPAILFFLAATFYLYGCDQNRGQAWFYVYWVMLLLNILPGPIALAACRLAFSTVYFWAGIQKLNGSFAGQVPGWFVQPATDWGWPHPLIAILRTSVLLTLIFILFGGKQFVGLPETVRALRPSPVAALIVGLYGFLPILSFVGLWDSYFSFSLYSYNAARAEVYLSQSCVARLPSKLQAYVYPVKNYNPALQLPYMFEYSMWADADMGSPPLPEPRGYKVLFKYIASYAANDGDCLMLLKTRTGRIFLYRPGAPPLELQGPR